MPSITYTGTFGGQSAGTEGLSTTQTGPTLPNNARIVGMQYSIHMTAERYSSSKVWRVHHFYLNNGSPSAGEKDTPMASESQTITGSMTYSQDNASIFTGRVTLYAKANTTHSVKSFMRDVTVTIEYELSYDITTGMLSADTQDAGTIMTITLSNDRISALKHDIVWNFGSYTHTVPVATGVTRAEYRIPLDWISAIPSATSGTGTVEIRTYSGSSYVGSNQYVYTMNVPANIIPTVSDISIERINNDVPSSWGVYVQNRSGVRIRASGSTSPYGGSISSYMFSVKDSSGRKNDYTKREMEFTISPILLSGELTLSVCATDSRGRTSAAVEKKIVVETYNAPKYIEALAFRCGADGLPSDNGTYLKVKTNASYDTLGGRNTLRVSCQYQRIGDSSWSNGKDSMTQNSSYVIGNGSIGINYTYHVKFILQDTFESVEQIVDVSTTPYTIFFRKGGTGVGFGKVCEHDYRIEINPSWRLYHGNDDLIEQIKRASGISVPKIIYSPSQPSGSVGAIWLKPKR